jgi:hypothetical protein
MPQQIDWPDNAQPKVVDQGNVIAAAFSGRAGAAFSEAETAFSRDHEGDGITITVVPDREGGIDYMYVEHEILVSDEHVERVLYILGDERPRRDVERAEPARIQHVIGDIFLITLLGTRFPLVSEALREIDRLISEDAATPNHVLTVAGGVGSPCPATEPEEVYYETEPFPSACHDGGGIGVRIYMTDTGLLEAVTASPAWRHDHPWLAHGVSGDPDPGDGQDPIPAYTGHGTFSAGVARCLAPEAQIFVNNEFRVAGSTFEADLVRRLARALRGGVDIFHLGIAAHSRHDRPLRALGEWLRLVRQYEGVVCVASAGNSGMSRPTWPGSFPDVVCVGALGSDWHGRASFSNFGGWVDVYAPGRDLINGYASGTYECCEYPYGGPNGQNPPQTRQFYGMCKWSGTSFSAPLVAGLIAARMSRTGENGRQAAAALLAEAREHAIPGIGPILLPRCGSQPERPMRCGGCGGCGGCTQHHRC